MTKLTTEVAPDIVHGYNQLSVSESIDPNNGRESIVCSAFEKHAAHASAMGQAYQLALAMRLHEETVGRSLGRLMTELRHDGWVAK